MLLLLVWIGVVHWREGGSLVAAAAGIAFVLALFGCVVLHELGHALAARLHALWLRSLGRPQSVQESQGHDPDGDLAVFLLAAEMLSSISSASMSLAPRTAHIARPNNPRAPRCR